MTTEQKIDEIAVQLERLRRQQDRMERQQERIFDKLGGVECDAPGCDAPEPVISIDDEDIDRLVVRVVEQVLTNDENLYEIRSYLVAAPGEDDEEEGEDAEEAETLG